MNSRQAAKLAAIRIAEDERIMALNKADIIEYNNVIQAQIAGKSPCPWCMDYPECQLQAKDGFGCEEWALRWQIKAGDPDERQAEETTLPVQRLEEQ